MSNPIRSTRRKSAVHDPIEALEPRLLLAADVVVNEIMYQATSRSEGDEWIELYNRGNSAANLAGWKITKGVNFSFGAGTLGAGQYLVVAADLAQFQAKYPAVTNVVGGWSGRLSNSGEEAQIEDSGGVVVDKVSYADSGDWANRRRGPLDHNHMGWDWIQPASGGGSSLELINPLMSNNNGENWSASTIGQGTPGAMNSVFSTNIAPLISNIAQFPIVPKSTDSVTITADLLDELGAAQSATLHWRLDGAASFTAATMVDNGTNGDAVAGDGTWTAVVPPQSDKAIIEFYVSASDGALTRTWPAPTDDSGTQGANALYQVDDTVYTGTFAFYRLIMTESERAELAFIGSHSPDDLSNAEMNATFIAVDSTGSQIRYRAGVRNRGHGSRLGTPNNYHVDFTTDNLWKGEKATNFNARTPYAQVMGSAIWRDAGFAVQNEVPVQMRVNGDIATNSGGAYSQLEEPDSVFANTHFPDDPNGNFYGAFRLDPNLVPEAELQYLGTDPDSYRGLYPKQSNSEQDDYSDLIHLTDVLNNTPASQLFQAAQSVINLNEWLHYIALDNLMENRETGLVRGIGDDYNLYRGEIDQRFLLVPHDLDTLLGQGGSGKIDQSIFAIIEGVPGETNGSAAEGVTGLKKLLQLPEVLPLYYQAYLDLIQNVFNPASLDPLIDQVVGGFASPTQITSMKNFIVNRSAAVLAQIPQTFLANSSLSTIDGYKHTTDPAASFNGSANASITRSVLVNGLPATYNPRTGAWAISTTTTTTGGTNSTSIIGAGAVWKYKDDGSNQGTDWIANSFNDSSWASGPAQLGYSEGQENDEATLINGGPVGDHFITTYFRKSFNVANAASISGLTMSLLVDDGAEVYLNGQLIESYNMPGTFTYTTPASSSSLPENTFVTFAIDPSKLVEGTNYLAVEVHQGAPTSSDVSFDLRLDAISGQATVILPKNSTWKYLADGSNQGTAWATVGFDDSTWASGAGVLGHGNSNQTTLLPGSPAHVTNYFRRDFTITDVSEISGLTLHLMRDDGAVIWINGTVAASSNMPATWVFNTIASSNVAGSGESTYFDLSVNAAALALLHNGQNVIAVELHDSANSVNNDVSFDLSMDATVTNSGPTTVTGGVPLHPGVNRVTVQAFDGFNGTGNVVDSSFLDVWYEGTNNGTFTPDVPVDNLTMTVPDSYRPGTPFLVQIQANNAGEIQRDLWDGMVTLTSDRSDITFVNNQVVLRNGWGSVLVTPTGAGTASGSFMLSATLGNKVVSKSITSLNGAGMTSVLGTLAGGAVTWGGIMHVTGNVIVPAGTTLTIQPGTLVLVDGVASGTNGFTITVNGGSIQSLGTAADPVEITAINPAQYWGGLSMVNAQPSLFQYTQISHAGNTAPSGHTNTGPALRSSNSAITLDHSAITDNIGKAGDLSGQSLTLLYSEISRSRSGPELSGMALSFDHSWIFDNRGPDDADGIYLHDQQAGQTITLQHGMIGAVDDDDIDTLGSVIVVDDMILRDAKDKGVSVLNGEVTVKNSLIADNSLASEDATFSSISAKNNANGDVTTVNIDHTTIVANDPAGLGRDVGIESRNKFGLSSGTINYNVTNSIIVATKPVNIESPYLASTVHISYSDTFGTNWAGTGNLNADPMFVDPANHNYRPQVGAPEIDAGDPAAANDDSDGTRSDQGFFRNGIAGADAGQTIPGGTLSGVTTLTAQGGPYTITGNVIVPVGATLNILPGTSVFFAQDAGITVNGGRIVANGTQYEQIRFTHTPGTATVTWAGIQINGSTLDNQISYAVLEYGTAGTTNNGMIGVSSSRATLDHLYFDKTDRRRLRFNNASIVLTNSEFTDIFPGDTAPTTDNFSEDVWGSGILAGGEGRFENNIFGTTKGHNDIMDIDTAGVFGQSYIVRDNVFKGGGDDALDVEGDILIEGNTFSNFIKDLYNITTGNPGNSNVLSAGMGHNYTMVGNTIINSEHAAQVKENSFLTFVNNTVVGGAADDAAIYFFRPDQPGSWGKGAYIDGNIFKDKPIIVSDYTNTTQITLNRNIVPADYFGFGVGNTSEDPRFVDQTNGDFALRPGSPAIGSGPNGVDMGALVRAWVSISGEPAATVGKTSATLTVGGGGITAYKYRLNNGAYSAETPITTPINLSGLTSGSYTVYVIGKNAAGEWQSEASPTASRTWAVDTATPSVRINEVLASNTTVLSNGGQFPDLIELYNDGDGAVDLSGMSISDDAATPRKFVFAAGTIIGAGQYLILYADSKTVGGQIHTGFSLKNDGEGVYLFNTTGAGGGLIDGVTFGAQLDNLSIGRAADGSWVLDQPTFGAANVAARTGDASTLKVNEWLTAGLAPFTDDFVEVYNPDPLPIAVGGFYLSDDPIPRPGKSEIPALSFISGKVGAGGYRYFVADGNTENGALHTNFKLASEQGMIGLFDPSKTKIDWVLYLTQRLGESEGRSPDGGNEFEFYDQPNPGLPNPGVATSALPLRITEINYNPPAGGGTAVSSDFEFIEFKNTGDSTINLNGVQLAGEVNFTFGDVNVGAGEYVVIVRDPTDFALRYGTGINIGGVFSDALNDDGGQLRLLDSSGATVLDFGYSDIWQPTTDGGGDTLVAIDPNAAASSWGAASSWRASGAVLGTPGIDEAANLNPPEVVINEILAHSAGDAGDWIELHNTTGASIDLSGWYLSDNAADTLKYALPAGSIIAAGGYLVLNQADTFGTAGSAHPFSLNGDGGELYLSSSSTPGILGGYRQGITFGASDVGVTQGRFTTSTGAVDFVALSTATAGAANSYPQVGPVVITEIQYNPAGSASEFIELHNTSDSSVPLYDPAHPAATWKVTNGIDYSFDPGISLAPGAFLLVVPIDPALFRQLYDVPASVQIVGPFQGSLSNSGETLELSRPGTSENGAATQPYVVADRVSYGTSSPWVTAPDGNGPSLGRKGQTLYGNDPTSWVADTGSDNGSPGAGTTSAAPTVSGSQLFVEGNRISFVFSEDVSASLGAGDLVLQNLTTGQTLPAGSFTLSYDAASNTATWTSTSVLPDGNYKATLSAAGISDTAAHALDGDGNGTSGDNYILNFFAFGGDANHDRMVSFADLVTVAQHYGQTGKSWVGGDFNGDGAVNFADLVAVAQHYGKSLAPEAAAIPAAPVAASSLPESPAGLAESVAPAGSSAQTIAAVISEDESGTATAPIAKPSPLTIVSQSQPMVKAAAATQTFSQAPFEAVPASAGVVVKPVAAQGAEISATAASTVVPVAPGKPRELDGQTPARVELPAQPAQRPQGQSVFSTKRVSVGRPVGSLRSSR